MYCEKCGTKLENDEKVCTNCGNVLEEDKSINNYQTVLKKIIERVDIIYFVIAGIVLIMFFSAASSVSSAGNSISEISSVGGKTLEEAYYHNLRGVYSGISTALSATGITLSSILAWFGIKSKGIK